MKKIQMIQMIQLIQAIQVTQVTQTTQIILEGLIIQVTLIQNIQYLV